jgi:hypothetical protein
LLVGAKKSAESRTFFLTRAKPRKHLLLFGTPQPPKKKKKRKKTETRKETQKMNVAELLAADDVIRTVMRLDAGVCVRATRVTTAQTIQRAIVGVCSVGGWFEEILVDVGPGRSTESTAFVDGEPYEREVRVYTRGTGLVRVEVDTEPDAGGFVEPREARAIAERRRGLDPMVVWSESASGPWLVSETATVPLGASVYVALADAATGARLVLAPRSTPALRVVGTALVVETEGTFVVSVEPTKGVEVDGLSVLADVRATTRQIRVVRAAPTVTGPSVVASAPGLTLIRFVVTSSRAGTLVVVVDDEPELWFPIVASASVTTVDAMVGTENRRSVRATIKGTQATCVVRLAAPAVAARLVSAWVLSSASARLAVTPAGISTRVRRVAVELLGADGTRAEVESADAVWLDERGEPVSPAARAQAEDGLLVLARDQATAIGMVVVREGARTRGGGVTYAPLSAVNGTSMAATAVCEPWHIGRDALVGLVAGSPVACELRFRHRYCAAVPVAPSSFAARGAFLVRMDTPTCAVVEASGADAGASGAIGAIGTVVTGLVVDATFDEEAVSLDVVFVVYPSSTTPFGAPFSALGAVLDRPVPWPVEYTCASTPPNGFVLEHATDGVLLITPLACALGYAEETAWMHDTHRGRSVCFDSVRVPIVAPVASAVASGRVISVVGAAIRSVGSVLVGGVGSTFGIAEGKVVLDADPGQLSVELVLVVCARLAAASIVVVEQGARAFLCADAAWRAGRSYELTPVDSHGRICGVPPVPTFPLLEASVDGSVWVPVPAAFTVEEARLVVVPETWGAFTERRVVLAPGRVVRVVTLGTTSHGEESHADFTFGAGSLVSASPTISHGANNVSTTGSITAARCSAGAFFATSDARLKTNVATIDGALEKCARMRGVTFEYAADRGTVHVGLIAQEVAAVFPSLVTEIDGFQRVDYSKLVGVLIEAVKELKDRR